jgi:hypothetical protein
MTGKQAIQLARLTRQDSTKQLASQLAGKECHGEQKTWTKAFAASGAKPGAKGGGGA